MITCVIGGGAAGMLSAISARNKGYKVILLEKNEKLGKKIYITGKGRCNLTNNSSVNDFMQNVVVNNKFLFSALNNLSPLETISLFERLGLKLKTERGNRVFPESDKSSSVIKCLENYLFKLGVDVRLNTEVRIVSKVNENSFEIYTNNETFFCNKVIIATGGVSYPLTGSTGDGYDFAKRFGHSVVTPKPSLVGIELKGVSFKQIQGLSLKNVRLSIYNEQKCLFQDFGEMLFTHFGVSGPIVLSSSCLINKFNVDNFDLIIDLKPALTEEVLDQRLVRETSIYHNKTISNMLRELLPKSLIEIVLRQANVSQTKSCSNMSKEERFKILQTLKSLKFKIKKLRPIEEAIITSGGINVKEINPKTMESKLVSGLYFAGEVIDVDAFTGGYNLQIAFSTGYLAGQSC